MILVSVQMTARKYKQSQAIVWFVEKSYSRKYHQRFSITDTAPSNIKSKLSDGIALIIGIKTRR